MDLDDRVRCDDQFVKRGSGAFGFRKNDLRIVTCPTDSSGLTVVRHRRDLWRTAAGWKDIDAITLGPTRCSVAGCNRDPFTVMRILRIRFEVRRRDQCRDITARKIDDRHIRSRPIIDLWITDVAERDLGTIRRPVERRNAASHCRQEAQTKIRADLFKRYGVEIDRAAIREFTTGANSVAGSKATDKADAKPAETTDATPQQ